MKHKLRRIPADAPEAWIAGVCAGAAYWLGTPVWIVRLFWVITLHGPGIVFYILLWIFMPEWEKVPSDFKEVTGD